MFIYMQSEKKRVMATQDILLYIGVVKKDESKLRTLRCLLGILFLKKEKQRTNGRISGRRIKRPSTVRLSLNLESAPLLPSVVSTAKTLNPTLLLCLPLQSARVFD